MITEDNPLIAIDINLNEVKSDVNTYYRLDDGIYNFIKKVEEKYEIIGFEYNGTRTFGFICKEK